MPWVKILNGKNPPNAHKAKVYGINFKALLIIFFIAIVIFLLIVYIKQPAKENRLSFKATQLRQTDGRSYFINLSPVLPNGTIWQFPDATKELPMIRIT